MAKRIRICLETVLGEKGWRCVKSAIIKNVGGIFEIYMVKIKKDRETIKKIAKLPKIKLIHDPSGDVYAAFNSNGKIFEVAMDLRSLLEALIDEGYIVPLNMLSRPGFQKVLNKIIEEEYGFVDPGITMDGIVDPRGVGLDLEEHPEHIKTLEDIIRWIEKAYPSERNRKIALANIAFLLAKVVSPAIRMKKGTFVDHFVWNVGRGEEGKTTLVSYIMLPLLGIDQDINEKLYIYVRAVEKTQHLRSLLAMNRMPLVLILDKQTKRVLMRNIDIIMSGAVGRGIIDIQIPKHGGGIRRVLRSNRGVIILTDTPFSEFLKKAAEEASDYAIARRVIVLEWDNVKINPEAFDELPQIKPILGNIDAVWKRHRDELLSTADLKELTLKLLELLEKDYGVNLKVYKDAVEEVWRIWENRKAMLLKSDEDLLVERASEISRKLLGNTNITGLGLLESIIDNPHVYGVKFTYSKSNEEKLIEIRRLRWIICKDFGNPDPQDYHPLCGSTRNVKNELYSLDRKLRNYYESGYTYIVVKARSLLCPGAPKQFLGFPVGSYSDGGTKFSGYKIPISRFIEIFIGSGSAKRGSCV